MASLYAPFTVVPTFVVGDVSAARLMDSSFLVDGGEVRISSVGVTRRYIYDESSTLLDDGIGVIRTTDISSVDPGRLILVNGEQFVTSTSGNGSSVIYSAPLKSGSSALIDVRVAVTDGATRVYTYSTSIGDSVGTLSGFGTVITPVVLNFTGIPVSLAYTYLNGVMTITGTGPQTVVTGAASNGSGGTRLTVVGPVDPVITGKTVTTSGIVPSGLNGNFNATYVSPTTFDINVAFVSFTSGGLVVYRTAPLLKWATYALLVTAN